ncbi:hypothetical protein ACE1BY_20110, partial [Aeromonas jandaei]|uniref:hypothetical protein n=2 Tax=Aeromonas jandaei TaxID=650 RepID=UPI0035B7CBE8
SRVKPYLQRLFEVIDSGSALPLAVSMEAHYRDPDHFGKGVFALNSYFQRNRLLIVRNDDLFHETAHHSRLRLSSLVPSLRQIRAIMI